MILGRLPRGDLCSINIYCGPMGEWIMNYPSDMWSNKLRGSNLLMVIGFFFSLSHFSREDISWVCSYVASLTQTSRVAIGNWQMALEKNAPNSPLATSVEPPLISTSHRATLLNFKARMVLVSSKTPQVPIFSEILEPLGKMPQPPTSTPWAPPIHFEAWMT